MIKISDCIRFEILGSKKVNPNSKFARSYIEYRFATWVHG